MLHLYKWQEKDADWLTGQNSLLAHDCGLGKTVIAVEAVMRSARGPILVISPRMVKPFWKQTIEEQGGGFVGVCGRAGRGIPWKRVASWGRRKPLIWVVVHPAAVRLNVAQLSKVRWDTIIVDEAHRFKNRKAKQTKALKRIKARRKLMLTATPYSKTPADMWALLHFLYPKRFTSYWRFYDNYVDSFRPPNQRFRIVKGPKNLRELAKEVGPIYRRRTKSEVLDLPELVYTDVPVSINGRQEALYTQLRREAYAELVGKEIILQNALVKVLRLQQCALDPSLLAEGLPDIPLGTLPAKVEWLMEWLADHPNEPVVITSRYRRFVEKWLRELAPDATIVGGMKQASTQAALKTFKRTGVLVGSLDAIKEGLSLHRASTMIITDGTWSSTAEYQLSQRIHRIGQTRSCQVIHLVGQLEKARKTTVDQLIRDAVTRKWRDAELVASFIKGLQGN